MLLEFQVDEGILADDRKIDPRTADAAALQETYFLMPTRLQVHQEELFAVPPKGQQKYASPWLALPLLHVATVGLQKVKDIGKQGQVIYTLPGSGWRLRFETCGQDVSIHSEVNGRQSCVHYAELLAAFEHFASTAREVLSRKIPELQHHPYWGKWLSEIGSETHNATRGPAQPKVREGACVRPSACRTSLGASLRWPGLLDAWCVP